MARKSTSSSAARKEGGAAESPAKVAERSEQAPAKRRATKAEPPPMKWKVMAFLDGLALTLLKSQEKSVAEGEAARLVAEGRYQEVTVYPIDEDVPPPNPAKQEQEHARAHRDAELAGKAASKAARKPASKGGKASAAAAGASGKKSRRRPKRRS
jgi:hypothetical protein